MVEDRDSFLIKAKNFFILNWWTLWIVIVFSMVFTVYLNMQTRADIKETIKMLDKNSKGVVMLTYAGTPIYGEKTIIDIQDENFQKSLKSMLQKYLITDASRVTNDYRLFPAVIEDVFNTNEELNDFAEYYLKPKEDANAFNYMKEHLKVILALLKEDNLPETIVILKSNIDKYEIKNNTFNATIFVDVKLDYYLSEKKEWERKRGAVKIEASGKFDSAYGDAFNPLGIKINTFSVTYPKKRDK